MKIISIKCYCGQQVIGVFKICWVGQCHGLRQCGGQGDLF